MSTPKFPIRWLAAMTCAALLGACSGGGSGERLNVPPPDPEVLPASAVGKWGPLVGWPLIPIHAALLPDGRILSYGTQTPGDNGPPISGAFTYDLWTPADGTGQDAHLVLPNLTITDLFCSAQLLLPEPDAGVLIVGGDTFPRFVDPDPTDEVVPEDNSDGNSDSNIFDYAGGDTLDAGPGMNRGRWYGSVTTLLDGRIYIQGGKSETRISGADRPEVRELDGTFRLLPGADTSALRYYYPRGFVLPDGRLFGFDTRGTMYYVDPTGPGSLTTVGEFPELYQGDDSTVAMFRPGRLLQFGGNRVPNSSARGSLVIDARGPAPVLTPSGDLSSIRRLSTATILADGKVLATGGSVFYNTTRGANLKAEIWDPVTGAWTLGAPEQVARLYHSTALLLPDATVLVGGGGAPGPPDLPGNLNAEIYSPPYLFTASGALAPRPSIGSAPAELVVGRNFQLGYGAVGGSDTAARVVLIKTSAVTHNLNMEQRFVELPFSILNSTRLNVYMTSRAGDVTPGYYLLFVFNKDGVPSKARTVFVGVAPAKDAAADPVVVASADRTDAVGAVVTFNVAGTDPAALPLSYAAAGLPPGVSLSAGAGSSARISGTPTAAGSYDVVVTASNGTRTATNAFVWQVQAPVTQ
ncbi:galactose oxidase-like domain-containing protein [Panacagrimonas perspica]|nr:galactose oxidase-like domain-containing protein [Panacagrimonas perspica]